MTEEFRMTRKRAAALIEDIRTRVFEGNVSALGAEDVLRSIQNVIREAGIPELAACDGEAHSNAHIDNCMCCAPRWGVVGPSVKIT